MGLPVTSSEKRSGRGRPKSKQTGMISIPPPRPNEESSSNQSLLNFDVKRIENHRNTVEEESSSDIDPDLENENDSSSNQVNFNNENGSSIAPNDNKTPTTGIIKGSILDQLQASLTSHIQQQESLVEEQCNEQQEECNDYFTYGETQQQTQQQTQKQQQQQQTQLQSQSLFQKSQAAVQQQKLKKRKRDFINNNKEDEYDDYHSYSSQTQRNPHGTQSITLDDLLNPEQQKLNAKKKKKNPDQYNYEDIKNNTNQAEIEKEASKNKKSLFGQYFVLNHEQSQARGPNHLETQRLEGDSIADILVQEQNRGNEFNSEDQFSLRQIVSSQERAEKQALARKLYNDANNFQSFNSVQENQIELLEAMQYLSDPNVIMIDTHENKMSGETKTFCFFDVKKKVLLNALNLEQNGKNFLQVVNFSDRVFLIERIVIATKSQKLIIYEYIRESGNLNLIFEETDHKKIKPVCFGHKTRLYILLVNTKSILYDFSNKMKIIFDKLGFQVTNSNDLKTIVVNDRELYLFHCSKSRSQGEIFTIDLLTLAQWKRIEIKTDNRPKDLIQFGMLPYRKQNDAKYIVLLFGGTYNTLRQCFLFDDFKKDISRVSIYSGDIDKILTNQVFIAEDEIIAFGENRIHLYDRKTQKFKAMCYDFQYDENAGGMRDSDEPQLYEEEDRHYFEQLSPGKKENKQNSEQDRYYRETQDQSQGRDIDIKAIREFDSQYSSTSSAMPSQIHNLLQQNNNNDELMPDISQCANLDDLCN
ncbi:UNKNOWN [Stylonychia lemnae]|uniref:Uncharacterized protein n=1 Tax=Stylonychia lemnae TaxID=5949 RepID=A0A077ZT65_STYLE|nr:UNKNOWN [Stylonychia lemnae]|eukprot:CDW71656.1 UNKNOWN [Stylonychia lemnae]